MYGYSLFYTSTGMIKGNHCRFSATQHYTAQLLDITIASGKSVQHDEWLAAFNQKVNYQGRSINKLQKWRHFIKGAIPKYTFCREFNFEHIWNLF